jgi:hypothetical protein
MNAPLKKQVFALLNSEISPQCDKRNGRPGMALWNILVLGVLRLDLNEDYDRILELANEHTTLRLMLGHDHSDKHRYDLQTIKRNVQLLTVEIIEQINNIVVSSGHALLKKKDGEVLHGRCDSFVVETNVHFPTDINLLFDAMRKAIQLTAKLSDCHGLSDWRQSKNNIRHLKKSMRHVQNKKRSRAKDPALQDQRQTRIEKAHQTYLDIAQQYFDKVQNTLSTIAGIEKSEDATHVLLLPKIQTFIAHAERQIDQIKRRVIQKETIPHEEKVLSVFEEHTEWVSKGKAGVPVELGVKVCILEDEHQFILHHQVMLQQADSEVAEAMVIAAKKNYPNLTSCSFDKGFHSPENQRTLPKHLTHVVLPRKGRLSKEAHAIEHSEEFIASRHQHSAVESGINALEVHGLDRCNDRGVPGFRRYVAMAALARNIHRLGDILHTQAKTRALRKRKFLSRKTPDKLAA